jgi:hypothetical protein
MGPVDMVVVRRCMTSWNRHRIVLAVVPHPNPVTRAERKGVVTRPESIACRAARRPVSITPTFISKRLGLMSAHAFCSVSSSISSSTSSSHQFQSDMSKTRSRSLHDICSQRQSLLSERLPSKTPVDLDHREKFWFPRSHPLASIACVTNTLNHAGRPIRKATRM